jgi:hypothetical protein
MSGKRAKALRKAAETKRYEEIRTWKPDWKLPAIEELTKNARRATGD